MRRLAILVVATILAVYLPTQQRGAKAQRLAQPACSSVSVMTGGNARALATANNTFGLRLFTRVQAANGQSNLLISPASAAAALEMTYDGARGSTQQAMARALALSGNRQSVLRNAAALLTTLQSADPSAQLEIANAIWGRAGVSFKPAFLRDAHSYYGAKVTSLNFTSPQTLSVINNWVSCATHGKITSIVDRIPQDIVMYLMNAVYFHGLWTYPFDPKLTHNATFTTESGHQVSVPFMSRLANFLYSPEADVQVVGLPYGSSTSGRFDMIVILPRVGMSVQAVGRKLSATTWESWTSHLQAAHLSLQLPRFTLSSDYMLNSSLKQLGMGQAFAPKSSDFSGMCASRRCYISQVRQKTYLSVDEKGTTAAGVTSVGVGATAVMAPIVVNRPFIVAVRDKTTGAILFLGTVRNPS